MKIELTAYRTVYEVFSKEVEGVGFGFDVNLSKLLRHLAGSLSLQAEAEAEYAAFLGIQHAITLEALDGALTSIKETIDHRDNQVV